MKMVNQNNFYDTRIKFDNEIQSKTIQEILFKLKIKWNSFYAADFFKFKEGIEYISINGDRYCDTHCQLHINKLSKIDFDGLKCTELKYDLLLKYLNKL